MITKEQQLLFDRAEKIFSEVEKSGNDFLTLSNSNITTAEDFEQFIFLSKKLEIDTKELREILSQLKKH